MLANDRTFDGVSVQLDDFNTIFRVAQLRPAVPAHSRHARPTRDGSNRSLPEIQREVNALRDG